MDLAVTENYFPTNAINIKLLKSMHVHNVEGCKIFGIYFFDNTLSVKHSFWKIFGSSVCS